MPAAIVNERSESRRTATLEQDFGRPSTPFGDRPRASPVPVAAPRNPLVSVIIPTFNRIEMLRELLTSLERQAWRPLETIVVDDGSTDGTFDAIEAWAQRSDFDIILLRQDNAGPGAARNRGLAAATGAFIYFIDSDDLALPHGLASLCAALRASDAPYCLARVRNVDRHGHPVLTQAGTAPRVDAAGIVGSVWPTHAALYRTEAMRRAGPFNERLLRGEDTELNWRLLATCGTGLLIDEVVGLRRLHPDGRLSDDMSPASLGLSAYRKIDQFVSWAGPRDKLAPHVATNALKALAIAIVRLRASGDRETLRKALSLGDELVRRGARRTLLFWFATGCGSARIARSVLRPLHAIRDVRNDLAPRVTSWKAGLRGLFAGSRPAAG